MDNFGIWLLQELEAKNMTQAKLARACGISTAQMSRIVSGSRGVSNDTLIAMADALQISRESILRAAKLLPLLPERDINIERIHHLLGSIYDDDLRTEALDFIEFIFQKQIKRIHDKNTS